MFTTSAGASQNVRTGRRDLEDRIIALERRLADKEEELRVALRWNGDLESKLEDAKDHLRNLLSILD
jgi:hypothetical protein